VNQRVSCAVNQRVLTTELSTRPDHKALNQPSDQKGELPVKGRYIHSTIAIIERTQAIKHGILTWLPQAAPRGYARRKAISRTSSQNAIRLSFLSAVNTDRTICGKYGSVQARSNRMGPAKNSQSGAIQRERRKMKHTIVLKRNIGITTTTRAKASNHRYPAYSLRR